MSGRRTGESGSTSWPTVTVSDSHGHQHGTRPDGSIASTLAGTAQMWRTPDAILSEPKSSVQKVAGRSPSDPQVSLADQAARMWPTPTAQDDNKTPEAHLAMKARMPGGPRSTVTSLNVAAKLWPTPNASNSQDGETPESWLARKEALDGRLGNSLGMPLAMAARLWPTPKTPTGGAESRASRASRGSGGEDLGASALAWPTPTAKLGDQRRGSPDPELAQRRLDSGRRNLDDSVAAWPTPTANNPKGGYNGHSRGGQDLVFEARNWPTPMAADSERTSTTMARGNPTLIGAASGLHDPTTSTPGEFSSTQTRVLNPRFTEMLMGWPIGWSAAGSSVTAASLREWRRRSLSLLDELGYFDKECR